jgi:hypothetical protein
MARSAEASRRCRRLWKDELHRKLKEDIQDLNSCKGGSVKIQNWKYMRRLEGIDEAANGYRFHNGRSGR